MIIKRRKEQEQAVKKDKTKIYTLWHQIKGVSYCLIWGFFKVEGSTFNR